MIDLHTAYNREEVLVLKCPNCGEVCIVEECLWFVGDEEPSAALILFDECTAFICKCGTDIHDIETNWHRQYKDIVPKGAAVKHD